jgi:hypothetical protein
VRLWSGFHHLRRVGNLSTLGRERRSAPVTRPHEPRQVDVTAGSKPVNRKITPRLGNAAHNLPIVAAAVGKPLDCQVPPWQPGEQSYEPRYRDEVATCDEAQGRWWRVVVKCMEGRWGRVVVKSITREVGESSGQMKHKGGGGE